MKINETITYIVIGGICIAILFAIVASALSLPDVQFSYKTNECVKVLNYVEDENFSCENLPSKFNHVWIQ